MPKDTFFNLPKDKRERITNVAIDEFASYPFKQASVGRIIKKSKIASGSFYQYFQDKLDLYKHIIGIYQQKKLEHLKPVVIRQNETNFFDFFRLLYIEAIKFARSNPKMESISNFLVRDKELLSQQLIESEPQAIAFYKHIIDTGIKRGDLRSDLDSELTAYFLYRLGTAFAERIMDNKNIDESDMQTVDKMIDIIKSGLVKK